LAEADEVLASKAATSPLLTGLKLRAASMACCKTCGDSHPVITTLVGRFIA